MVSSPPPPTSALPSRRAEVLPPPPPFEELGPDLGQPKKTMKVMQKPKRDPPSIDDILKPYRDKKAAQAKPRFIPKAERERMAREESEKADEERRKQKEAAAQANAAWLAEAQNGSGSSKDKKGANGTGAVPTGPRAMRSDIPTGPSSMRQEDVSRSTVERDDTRSDNKRPRSEDAQWAKVRERYMGPAINQSTFSANKKRKRNTENKFKFDWDASEDTTDPTYGPDPNAARRVDPRLGRASLEREMDKVRENMRRDPENAATYATDLEALDRRRRELDDQEKLSKRFGSKTLSTHWSEKKLEHMRDRDWRIFKEDFNITTKGGSIPHPMRYWSESGLPADILQIVSDVGYDQPSAIQRAAIPIALQSRDLIGVAVTGSGKTASFLLPLLVYIQRMPPQNSFNRNDGPYGLILAPTRELAQQIEVEARKFADPLGYRTAVLVGGHAVEEQINQLTGGVHIVIATPGRLLDCIERRVLVLTQCHYVIMDEADRMIDMGFEEPVNKILDALPSSNEKPDTDAAEDSVAMSRGLYRQTMMYTATMAPAVERIAKRYLRRPAEVRIGNTGEAVETVEQRVEFVPGEEKRKKRLQEILSSYQFAPPIIVFVNIKRNCDAVARDIKHMGFSSATLHGGKTQEQREAALQSLRDGRTEVLVATDLAGRGIDVPDVSLVVNFNMAPSIDSYTHRIGRTGRAGKTGVAITFWGNEDSDVLYDLKQMLAKSQISKVPEDLRKHEAAQQKGGRKKMGDGKPLLT